MRLTKIYTKGGDKGTTALVDGSRVPKDHARLDTYGTIDELNAAVGLARVFNERYRETFPDVAARVDEELRWLQNLLFDLGSDLATPLDKRFEGQRVVTEQDVDAIERLLDELNAELPPLESFVLPGGGPVSAYLHQARTVCRRAERQIVHLARTEALGEWVVPFVNRLSDLFFVLSRWVSAQVGEPESLWERSPERR